MKKIPQIDEIYNPIVLASLSERQRNEAKKALVNAKELEITKLKSGYEWFRNGKIAKLVHPSEVKKYLKNGWKIAHK